MCGCVFFFLLAPINLNDQTFFWSLLSRQCFSHHRWGGRAGVGVCWGHVCPWFVNYYSLFHQDNYPRFLVLCSYSSLYGQPQGRFSEISLHFRTDKQFSGCHSPLPQLQLHCGEIQSSKVKCFGFNDLKVFYYIHTLLYKLGIKLQQASCLLYKCL